MGARKLSVSPRPATPARCPCPRKSYTDCMASLSLSRLLRPFLWLLWLVLISLVLPVLLGFMTPILMLVWVIGFIPMFTSTSFQERMGVTGLGWLLWGVWWPVLLVTATVPALALLFAVLLHFFGQIPPELSQIPAILHEHLPREIRQWLPAPHPSPQDFARFFVVTGILGAATNLVYVFMEIPWRLKQIGQIRALPRAKARSAAIGLAEFEGIARAIGADRDISKFGAVEAQPFYLEDETGRIRVDPGHATIRARTVSGTALMLNEVEEGIRDGDPVYVIGNVQNTEALPPGAPDPDRRVVRPLGQSLVSSPVGRLLFPKRRQPADREAPNIFIVDKGREHKVLLRLRMALWDFCFVSVVYLAASLWLVQAAWPWLTPG